MNHYFSQLTQGAIGHILGGVKIQEPILQMLAYKNMPTENNKRYRLVLSDGAYTYQCCITMGDLAEKVENGEIDRYCLLKISRYMLNEIQGRQVIVLAEPVLLVKGSKVGEKLGDPVAFGTEGAPPLSNFRPNYHLTAKSNMSMDVEFENDPFGDIDEVPANKLNSNMAKKMKNERGQASTRQVSNDVSTTSAPQASTLNANLACPISSLTPYSNKWLIKGRVTSKTNKRSWSNAKGEGCLFAFDIKDASGDIRITAFKSECDRYFDLVKVDDVFLVCRGAVKAANRQYNHTTSEYEVTLNSDSIIEPCHDSSGCPEVRYDFKPLDSLQNYFGGFVDICVIIKEIQDLETIVRKNTNKELCKRNLIVVDQSKHEVELAIWGDTAINFKADVEDVIVIRGVKVSEYNNVSLSTTSNSTVEINPSLDEAHTLTGWYSRVKSDLQVTRLTEKKSGSSMRAEWNNLSEITPENVAIEGGFALQTKTTIYQIGKPNMYKACDCNKKLIDLNNGFYRCEKCSKEIEKFCWRIILTFGLADHTRNIWVQCFHDEAMKLLSGHNIDELGRLYESDPAQLDEILRTTNFSAHIFKLKSRMEHFNDENRIRTQVIGISPVNYKEYGNYLLAKIKQG